jgi:hypothetical protein
LKVEIACHVADDSSCSSSRSVCRESQDVCSCLRHSTGASTTPLRAHTNAQCSSRHCNPPFQSENLLRISTVHRSQHQSQISTPWPADAPHSRIIRKISPQTRASASPRPPTTTSSKTRTARNGSGTLAPRNGFPWYATRAEVPCPQLEICRRASACPSPAAAITPAVAES